MGRLGNGGMASSGEPKGKRHVVWALKEGCSMVIESYVEDRFRWQKRPQYDNNLGLQSISEDFQLWNNGSH